MKDMASSERFCLLQLALAALDVIAERFHQGVVIRVRRQRPRNWAGKGSNT